MANKQGYFDLQINGYANIDFQRADLSAEHLKLACDKLAESGVDGFLATIITDKIDVMCSRLKRLADLHDSDPVVKRLIAGIHIEGPFINPEAGFRGAHPEDSIHPANPDEMNQLLDAAGGLTKIVTLAPENDPGKKVTRMLADRGVTVSAGHCNPSLDDLKAGIDAGLKLVTHLGNGIPMKIDRHDNVIQRVLSLRDKLWLCFIADGAHIPFFALRNYLDLVGLDHAVVVTDCMAAAGMGPGLYRFGRWEAKVGEDMVARAPDGSHLLGAAITMPQTLRNLVEKVGLSEAQARKLIVTNPRKVLGLR